MTALAELLRDLVREKTGIHVDQQGLELFMEKMSSLIDERGFTSAIDYYYLLKYDSNAECEWARVINAISVRETYFWREFDAIRALVEVIIPNHFSSGAGQLRIWSAACASGEEPLSIAIAIEEAGLGGRPIEIIASDASSAALTAARAGIYRERSFRATPSYIRSRYFKRLHEGWKIDSAIHERIQWRQANLIREDEIAPLAVANVIFCRNLFIYFREDTIRKILATFARQMRPPAVLFVGAPESLLKLTDDFELKDFAGAFGYVRTRRAEESKSWSV